MAHLPTGTVTFLFTDIESSTRLWEQHPEAMRAALARHHTILADAIRRHGGEVVKSQGEGDSVFAIFPRATDAVAAACTAQQALVSEPWPAETPLRVRIALHTGEADLREGDYYGAPVNRCARLRAVAHGGQVLLSRATHELVGDSLPSGASVCDLGEHRLRDLTRPERIFQLRHPDLPADFPPLRSLDALPNNLPVQVTSFVGRGKETTDVKRLLGKTRLLTLTGAGGTGKTRLALQIAADLLHEYPDGVWLVELAPLVDPSLVPHTAAAVLGVREEPGRPLTETLVDALKPRTLLLILDNCEHLLMACAQLADALLRSCPNLRMLATSREGLGIGGEQTYRVPSLSLPDTRHPTPDTLLQFEAGQLFAERAHLAQAAFAVTEANAPAVAQVCQRLDGIPLAIELAAARVRVLSVEQIADRLDDRFRLLTGGSRTALPRQQTLRALIDWSYNLLAEPERKLFRRLSVFAGGWALGAAERVCAGEGTEEWEVLDLLTGLVDKSLVVAEEQEGEARYRLLETVRQYARDRLLEAGEAEVLRGRHRDWFLVLAEEAEPELEGADQREWLDRLEREHDNLRAALAWSRAEGQGEAGLRLGGALWPFWEVRGYWTEGREHLTGLLALPGAEARTTARAKVLHGSGHLAQLSGNKGEAQTLLEESLAISRDLGHMKVMADSLDSLGWIQGDKGAARELWEESLAIRRELGDRRGIAGSLHRLGHAAHLYGDYVAARALLGEGLAIYREVGGKLGIAWSLHRLGWTAHAQGDYGGACALYEESLAIRREIGHKQGIAWTLCLMGGVAHARGEHKAARALLEESLAIQRELGNKSGIPWALGWVGMAARDLGDYRTARAVWEDGLAIARERGHKQGIAFFLNHLGDLLHVQGDDEAAQSMFEESLAICRELDRKQEAIGGLNGMAAVAVAQGQCEHAARLYGAAEGLRETIGAPLPRAAVLAERDRSVAAARNALGEETFAAAWAQGRAMSLDEVVDLALEAE